jgi:hypothetical protein
MMLQIVLTKPLSVCCGDDASLSGSMVLFCICNRFALFNFCLKDLRILLTFGEGYLTLATLFDKLKRPTDPQNAQQLDIVDQMLS